MPNCKCAGQSCSCSIVAGNGIVVSGTGTAALPFTIALDATTFQLGQSLRVSSTSTIEMSQTGTGAATDPVVTAADLVLKSPNNTRWTIAVSNAGVLTAVAAGAPRTGAGGASGNTIVENEILYFNGTTWETRSTSAHVIWNSLGYNGVPVPPGFKANDTWLCEAT